MKGRLFIAWVFVLITGCVIPSKASHIVGGEFRYTSLNHQVSGGEIRYLVQFTIYMDCLTGQLPAIEREDTGIFRVYNANTKVPVGDFVVFRDSKTQIPADFSNACVNNPPNTCLLRNTYSFIVTLPNIPGGYIVATNNCCRNETIKNISNPGQTGASYYIELPERGSANSSAFFNNYPPQIICINTPFVYDHSATDPDGDSLSYEFGPAYNAKITTGNGQIFAQFTPPPYNSVNYNFGFSPQKPISGNPVFQINPTSGMITGTPTEQGRFVVAVYCHEWRNGVLINTVVREFQFVITNCSKAVVANIPQYSDEFNTYIVQCTGFTVPFVNLSEGGFTYFWDFGVTGAADDTSSDFEPTFVYPDTGVYIVKLVVNRGSTCPDSISRYVKVFPSFMGDFSFSGLPCPDAPISFSDSSKSTLDAPDYWFWQFGDGNTSLEENPVHHYEEGGDYNVILIAKNPKGCSDTVAQLVSIERFYPFAGYDTIIVKDESIYFNAQGGNTYLWTPATNLTDPNIGNPVGFYPDTGFFAYNVYIKSIGGCEGNDSIYVRVVNQSSIFVPTGFTPNGDGINEILKPLGVGYKSINYFRVFNRWGQQVFYTTKFEEGWDGRLGGEPQDIGTYYWILSITNRFGKEEIIKGDSALLR